MPPPPLLVARHSAQPQRVRAPVGVDSTGTAAPGIGLLIILFGRFVNMRSPVRNLFWMATPAGQVSNSI